MKQPVMFTQILKYLKSVMATALVLYLSFASPSEFRKLPPIHIPHADKFVHFGMFLILGLVLCYDFFKAHRHTHFSVSKFIAVCVLYPITLGGVIEIVQETWFYPRSGEWLDWLADIMGIIFALIVIIFLKKKGIAL